ncbi:MAG TPA: tetratricopeptide repeat protein [Prolixibacteraceae bacterium]|jgi:tetratricopeptide (TPR) repeat protein
MKAKFSILLICLFFLTIIGYSQTTAKWHADRASKYWGDNELALAIAEYTKVIEIDPNYESVYYNRATAKFLLGDYRGSIPDYNKAIESDPSGLNYAHRADAKNSFGDINGAIVDYTKAIEIGHWNVGSSYGRRGLCKLNLGQKDAACADFRKAGELGSKEAYEYINKYCQ